MKTSTFYDIYRLPSKVFFWIFIVCFCTWTSRIIRKTPSVLEGHLLWFRNADWPVWIEHFAASLGMPSLFLAIMYWACARPDLKKMTNNAPLIAFFAPVFFGMLSVILLTYGEAGHEIYQFMLSKKSNYGQHLATYCLPVNDIHTLAVCAQEYRATYYPQAIADVVGTFTFLCLFSYSTWRLAIQHVRSGAIQLMPIHGQSKVN